MREENRQFYEEVARRVGAYRAQFTDLDDMRERRERFQFPEVLPTDGPREDDPLVRRVIAAVKGIGVKLRIGKPGERGWVCHSATWACTENRQNGKGPMQMLPPTAYESARAFAGVALHEVGHWTGAPTRLARPALTSPTFFVHLGGLTPTEEMTAELTSLLLMHRADLTDERSWERSVAYVAAFLYGGLGDGPADREAFWEAAGYASAAVEYLGSDFITRLAEDQPAQAAA